MDLSLSKIVFLIISTYVRRKKNFIATKIIEKKKGNDFTITPHITYTTYTYIVKPKIVLSAMEKLLASWQS